MKILAIRGKNLASLEGEFSIDFTAEPLRSAGIFAITGPTGSGKSTLLDALCLALFDQTPRHNRATENINIVDVKDKTISQKDSRNILRRGTSDGYAEVDFLSLSGHTFRSRWSVRRSRDMASGSLQGADFRLTNLSSATEVQGRKTELLAKVVELTGFTFDQFTRAVLLAQGDFATFLKATQKDKAELLEKLTGTDIYSRISASIFEKSKFAEKELALFYERIEDIELLSHEDLEIFTTEQKFNTTEIELLRAEIDKLNAKIKWIANLEILLSGVERAQKELNDAQVVVEQAQPRYNYLAQVDQVQEIRERYTEFKSSEKQLAENKNNLATKEQELAANSQLLTEADQKVDVCILEQKQHTEAVATIEPHIRQARALDIRIEGAATNQLEAKLEYKKAVQSKLEIEQIIAATKLYIAQTEQKIVEINTWFSCNSQYSDIIWRIDLIINLLEDAQTAAKQGVNNTNTLSDNEKVLLSDLERLSVLKAEAERLNNLLPAEIALLRASLVDGSACPVCGSINHPTTKINAETIEESKLNRAKKEVSDQILSLNETIEARLGQSIRLRTLIDSYDTQYQEATAKLNGYLKNLPNWAIEFKEGVLQNSLRDIATNWNLYLQNQTKANEQILNLQTTLLNHQKNFTEIIQTLTTKEHKLKICNGELENLTAERAKILAGKNVDETEALLGQKAKEIAENLTKLISTKGNLAAICDNIAGIIAQITQNITKLTTQNITAKEGVDGWILAQNGTITLNQLEELLSKDNQWLFAERAVLSSLLERKAIAKATLAERGKTLEEHYNVAEKPSNKESRESIELLVIQKDAELDQKSKRITEVEIKLATHFMGREKLKIYEKELDKKRAIAEDWKRLNEMFGSADGAKFKVLAQGYTLDALLIYANKHLHQLSNRYELQRISDTLALQVVDLDMAGEVRTVHSLSGGESFLISLALALGLSALSSNRMKVESLFIDEGFGSLDIDTLSVAMDALERLQTQGRKIGVISHVAEMTERITTQIKVIKTSNGKSKIAIL